MVVSVISGDTNIAKNSFFEQVLGKDSILGLTFAIRNQQSIVSNTVLTEDNNRSVILILNLPLFGISIVISIITKDTNIVKNTVFETVLHMNSIS